ncbi:MAG: peroxiredoxin [bacterium]
MKKLDVGDKAIDFCLSDENGEKVCLKQYRGRWVVLYFYPKDNTAGCTLEAVDFTARMYGFDDRSAVVVGVSPDSARIHCSFVEKYELKVKLLSDATHEVMGKYGTWVFKKKRKKEIYCVERSTFLISPEGRIAFVWRNVKVKGHAGNVLQKLSELQ